MTGPSRAMTASAGAPAPRTLGGVASSTLSGAPRHPVSRRTPALLAPGQHLPAALAALTVLSQIAYPLCSGRLRDQLTVATVLLWCAASLSHAALTRGRRFAARLLVVSAGVGFAAEAIGVATGQPFGRYAYAATLGPRLAGVPLLVPLAWTMMAYPALLVGRRLGAPVLGGAVALASWDFFLDPQMVAAGHWRFTGSGPFVNGIPLSNTVGWIAVSLVIMLLLARLPEAGSGDYDDRIPLALYLWTYASGVLAAIAFFHHPEVAAVGGLAMGIPVLLLVRSLRRGAGPLIHP